MRTTLLTAAVVVFVIITTIATLIFVSQPSSVPVPAESHVPEPIPDATVGTASSSAPDIALKLAPYPGLAFPLGIPEQRITKKFFGTYITPNHSPVSPERFTGYHTGLDFETFQDEQDIDVPVHAICSGPLLMKKIASGYGGIAVEGCTLDGQAVTVVYGHIRLASVTASVHETLSAGAVLGVLGTGYSAESDGERKHLHLGIHKGSFINILGYVQTENALSAWLDPQKVLGL